MRTRSEKSRKLAAMLADRGYPQAFCDAVADHLNTDFTAGRMIGYLSHYRKLPEEEIVDEMLAILSDRAAIMQKKELEYNQSKINEVYRYGLFPEDED